MKSYTWTYSDSVWVRFTTHQAFIRFTDRDAIRVKFPNPNEDRLGLYNAKITADRMRELGYDFDGRVVAGIKSMRENVPFSAVLSEVKARHALSPSAPRTIHGYLIQIPRATDYQTVTDFMRANKITWR